jgi:hypothetical protein
VSKVRPTATRATALFTIECNKRDVMLQPSVFVPYALVIPPSWQQHPHTNRDKVGRDKKSSFPACFGETMFLTP